MKTSTLSQNAELVLDTIPEQEPGTTKAGIVRTLEMTGNPLSSQAVAAAIKELKVAQDIAHPSPADSRHWVKADGECKITRSKLYRSRFATGPGYAWYWLYAYTTPENDRPTTHSTCLGSLRDYLRRKYPQARQIETWK